MRKITIDNQFGRPTGDETATDAINDAISRNNKFSADIPVRSLLTRTLQEVAYTDREFRGCLSGGVDLIITADDSDSTVPAVRVAPADNRRLIEPPWKGDVVQVSTGSSSWQWDREAIVRTILGQEVARIFVNGAELYLYFKDTVISFTRIRIADDGRPLLYWSFTD